MGYIYIMTNPSFDNYVKIGYANDIDKRLVQLNRSECLPFAFRVYATYEVPTALSDLKLHDIIDMLDPDLRAIDTFNGKQRKREFYAMSPEQAYSILEAMAQIHGCEDKLVLCGRSASDILDERTASEVKKKLSPFAFHKCGIIPGESVEFNHADNENNGLSLAVADDKHVTYKDTLWSLSALATELLHAKWTVQGTIYFYYKGVRLDRVREIYEKAHPDIDV